MFCHGEASYVTTCIVVHLPLQTPDIIMWTTSQFLAISSCCTVGECLKEYDCVEWTGADISTVYNIDNYVPYFTAISEVRQ